MIKRSVLQPFKRITGMDVAVAITSNAPPNQVIEWLGEDHPTCRLCKKSQFCQSSWRRRLAKCGHPYETSLTKCPLGHWRAIAPLSTGGPGMVAVKLVCSAITPKYQLNSQVELLKVLAENAAFRLRGETTASNRPSAADARPAGYSTMSNPLLDSACSFIQEHLAECELSEAGVARALGVNASYLAHLFSSQRGERMRMYILRLRVERAKMLLVGTRQQIKCISFECGFGRANWFSEVFRRQTGMRPTEYRRSYSKLP